MISQPLKGIFAPIPTPFKEGQIDLTVLRSNLERWNETNLHGLLVLGSNGEAAYLKEEEKLTVVNTVVKEAKRNKTVLVGTGLESTQDTISLTERVADLGAHGAVVLPPHFFKRAMTSEALVDHFTRIADAVSIPIFIYNMPANTGINIPAEVVIKLSKHPNIVGVKDSSGDIVQIQNVINGVCEGFSVLAGSGSYVFPTLVCGGHGGICAIGNIAPYELVQIYDLVALEDYGNARKLQLSLLALNHAVTAKYGVSGLKAAMELVGLGGGDPRLPLRPLPEKAVAEIQELLRQLAPQRV